MRVYSFLLFTILLFGPANAQEDENPEFISEEEQLWVEYGTNPYSEPESGGGDYEDYYEEDYYEEEGYSDEDYDKKGGFSGGIYNQDGELMGGAYGNAYGKGYSLKEWEPPKLPEGVDKNWFLTNTEIPQVLKDMLVEDESALERYAINAHKACVDLKENGLLDFFTNGIKEFVRTKPKFCEAIKIEKTTMKNMVYMPTQTSPNAIPNFEEKEVDIHYENYSIDSDKLQGVEGLSGADSLILSHFKEGTHTSLNVPVPLEEQNHLSDSEKESLKFSLGGFNQSMKGVSPLLKSTLLSRLWGKLGGLEQMRALNDCPAHLSLNKNPVSWEINPEMNQENEPHFSDFMKICNADNIEEILPYLDDGVMGEFAIYLKSQPNPLSHVVGICDSWPESGVVTPRELPPTSLEKVLYNASIFKSIYGGGYMDESYFNLINKAAEGSLSEAELTALTDYTANGSYDRINAYEMWGRVGVWFATPEDPSASMEKYFEQNFPRPKRKDYNSDEEFNQAYASYIQNRNQFLPRLYGSPEQRAQVEEMMKENETDPMRAAISGTHLSQTSRDLRSAIESLDGFKGVTFGGHQLSGHLFKGMRLREGATFEPGFFMSTSTSQQTALSFLGIHRGAFGAQEDRRAPSEEVTGYLFVVKNEHGASVANYSQYKSENEVLLHPDARYRILKMETLEVDGTTYPNAQVVYIEEIGR
ncbi:MAG: ADP-ribosyltransferase [Bdellovibrionota bacterium]|nr:ADP-ribosyltransferase [Bdellovibrionota bacterium]